MRFTGTRGFGRVLLLAMLLAPAWMLDAQSANLNMYWIDVEGGASTLIVSPSGESPSSSTPAGPWTAATPNVSMRWRRTLA